MNIMIVKQSDCRVLVCQHLINLSLLLGPGQKCSPCEEHLQNVESNLAVYQELFPVGKCPAKYLCICGEFKVIVKKHFLPFLSLSLCL